MQIAYYLIEYIKMTKGFPFIRFLEVSTDSFLVASSSLVVLYNSFDVVTHSAAVCSVHAVCVQNMVWKVCN